MRVTRQMMDRQTLKAIRENMAGLKTVNQQITSGERIGTMSDDVEGSSELLRSRRLKNSMQTYKENLNHAKGVMSRASTTLESASEKLIRAREVTTQAATGTYSESDMKAMAAEIDGILEQLVADANLEHAGRYVFSGQKSETAPFVATRTPDGEINQVNYQGASTTTRAPVSSNRTVRVNLNGGDFFQSREDTFQTLISIRDAIDNGNQSQVQDLIDNLKRAHEGINVGAAEMGSEINGLKAIDQNLQYQMTDNDQRISDLNDTDMAEASKEYQRYMSALQATLKFASKANANSLLELM